MTCTGTHTVTQAEMTAGGNLVNTVTADSDQTVPTTDTNTIPITQSPAMTVDKTSTTSSVTVVGQLVTYSFLVTNTGNIPLSGITVTDPKVPSINCNGQTTLAVGCVDDVHRHAYGHAGRDERGWEPRQYGDR